MKKAVEIHTFEARSIKNSDYQNHQSVDSASNSSISSSDSFLHIQLGCISKLGGLPTSSSSSSKNNSPEIDFPDFFHIARGG